MSLKCTTDEFEAIRRADKTYCVASSVNASSSRSCAAASLGIRRRTLRFSKIAPCLEGAEYLLNVRDGDIVCDQFASLSVP